MASKFWVAKRNGGPLLLTPSLGGIPEAATPQYPLWRISYLSPESAASEQEIALAKRKLQDKYPLLLLTVPCPDGPPNRAGVVFRREGTVTTPWSNGRHGKAPLEAEEYLATVSLSLYSWGSDIQRGRPGYFLSGFPDLASLWRIVRVEPDLYGRQIFTLSPTKLASALPEVGFAPVTNDLLRQKLENDWREVQRCMANHLHSSLITAAKNVAESLVVSRSEHPRKTFA